MAKVEFDTFAANGRVARPNGAVETALGTGRIGEAEDGEARSVGLHHLNVHHPGSVEETRGGEPAKWCLTR
jgi:hypothetical protein